MELKIKIDEQVYEQILKICQKENISFELSMQLYFIRVIENGSVIFTKNDSNTAFFKVPNLVSDSKDPLDDENLIIKKRGSIKLMENKMTKTLAKRLFWNKGQPLYPTVTFSSRNKSAFCYWSNPDLGVLCEDWSLILNDTDKGKLYLFNIPQNSIDEFEVKVRSDKQNLIDLQIMYDDPTFTDNRSGISFKEFFVDEIEY